MYLTLKTVHISLISISVIIFIATGLMMIMKNNFYRDKIFRYIPPTVDTLLLLSGIILMFITEQYLFLEPWITVKLLALLLYIIFGTIALNRVNNYKLQLLGFIMALITIYYMYSVARTHHPLGFFL